MPSVPLSVGLGLGVCGAATAAWGMFAPRSRIFCRVISSGPSTETRRVALTFDDGPCPGATDRMLDALEKGGARGTFFVIGRFAREHPGLIARIHAAGHLIGNHSFDHHRLGMFGWKRYWLDQIARADEAVASVTGSAPRVFRPPMGLKSHHLAAAVRASGHAVVTWSRSARDGIAPAEERIARAMRRVRAAEIVLLHDGRDAASRRDVSVTARVLPRVLDELRERGLEPVRLDELISGEPRP